MGDPISIIGLALSAVGTIGQLGAQSDAAAAQKKAQKLAQRKADLAAQRERVKAIREARIRRGRIEATSALTGTAGSAGAIVALASTGAQLTGGLGFSAEQQGLAGQISAANIAGADLQSQAATFGAIGGVGTSIFQQAGGFKTIFGGNTPQ